MPAAAVAQDVRARGDALGGGEARDRSKVGTFWRVRQQAGGPVGVLEDGPPGDGRLVGVGGADDVEAGDRAQRGEVLDRLVGRAVLAEADRVVGPDVGDRAAS